MGYLDQLKNISNAPYGEPKKPKKPQESGCLGFLGSPYGASEKIHAADTYHSWLIHYPDRDPLEVACCPEATHAEILEWYPDALAAEPLTPTSRQPSAPLTASEETAIREWLALIEETDPATNAEVIGQCQRDADARDYFTRRAAAELPKPDPFPDDRRTCESASTCLVRAITGVDGRGGRNL